MDKKLRTINIIMYALSSLSSEDAFS